MSNKGNINSNLFRQLYFKSKGQSSMIQTHKQGGGHFEHPCPAASLTEGSIALNFLRTLSTHCPSKNNKTTKLYLSREKQGIIIFIIYKSCIYSKNDISISLWWIFICWQNCPSYVLKAWFRSMLQPHSLRIADSWQSWMQAFLGEGGWISWSDGYPDDLNF